MSLTSFLKQSGEVRALLEQYFPLPVMSTPFPPLRAAPLTKNYSMIGQGFDYLLRFYMQRNNPYAPSGSRWIADSIDSTRNPSHEKKSASPLLEQAHTRYDQYIEDGVVTDALLESCLHLAVIDGLVRAGEMRGPLGEMDPRDIQDLRNLLAIIPSYPFLEGYRCKLNPSFPFPDGADCDLMIGNELIEIKTTKFSEMRREYYQQVLGYFLLNMKAGMRYPVQHIGVYFSRHGYLWSVAIDTIASNEAFQQFIPLWDGLVEKHLTAKRAQNIDNFTITDVS